MAERCLFSFDSLSSFASSSLSFCFCLLSSSFIFSFSALPMFMDRTSIFHLLIAFWRPLVLCFSNIDSVRDTRARSCSNFSSAAAPWSSRSRSFLSFPSLECSDPVLAVLLPMPSCSSSNWLSSGSVKTNSTSLGSKVPAKSMLRSRMCFAAAFFSSWIACFSAAVSAMLCPRPSSSPDGSGGGGFIAPPSSSKLSRRSRCAC
mmetsp:Transcript_2747/g.5036  ORF Transcript_2747/g.5036 Transcript_2747/m.5036 type:complete len:203 (-) Transcript_2747:59-667(-)